MNTKISQVVALIIAASSCALFIPNTSFADGPAVMGTLNSKHHVKGSVLGMGIGKGSTGIAEVGTVTGDVRIDGTVNLETHVAGSVLGMGIAGGCGGARVGSVAESAPCKAGGGGGGLLGGLFGGLF